MKEYRVAFYRRKADGYAGIAGSCVVMATGVRDAIDKATCPRAQYVCVVMVGEVS